MEEPRCCCSKHTHIATATSPPRATSAAPISSVCNAAIRSRAMKSASWESTSRALAPWRCADPATRSRLAYRPTALVWSSFVACASVARQLGHPPVPSELQVVQFEAGTQPLNRLGHQAAMALQRLRLDAEQ